LTPECQELLGSLENATARLASLDRTDMDQVQAALAERARAIDAVQGWIAAEQQALRPVSPELGGHLTRDFEAGAAILVRLALDRDAARLDLMALNRAQLMLRGLGGPAPVGPTAIDCRG
jgi:hypothetical protein